MPERTLTVRIIGDDRSLQQAFKRSAAGGKQLQIGVSGVGSSIAKGFIGAAAGVASVQTAFRILGDSVDEASAINEEVSKSKQVFGDSSTAIVKWSDTTADAMGVSKRAALEATGIFGNLFRTVGLAPEASATMSRSLVQLAADLASFNNASPEDVLEAIRSGLIGEAEPMRRYGVLLSETRVQQRAMADTGKTVVTALTNQEKALARYEIILADTTQAQGDYARTSEGLANQTRTLQANLKNLEGNLGTVLIPFMLNATRIALGLTRALEKIGGVEIFGHSGSDIAGWVTGWKEIGFLIDHSYFAAKKTHDIIASTDFSKLDVGALPSATGALEFPGGPLIPSRPSTFQRTPKTTIDPNDPFRELKEQQARQRRQTLAFRRAANRSQRDFDTFVKGLGLKIDTAALTTGTADDLAALRQLEAAILGRISKEGRTFELAQQLVDVRSRISGVLADQLSASAAAFDEVLAGLGLKLDIAKTTRTFADDLRVLRTIESALLERIKAEGRTADLLRQLFENRQAQQATLADQRKASQFEALGLTAEGDKPTPSSRALLKRTRNLQEQIKGTVLDTAATRRKLRQIVGVLTDTTKKAGRDVRAAILDMLNDISSAFDDDKSGQGPLTKFAKRGVGKLIEGLGLTPEQQHEIRQRFSQFGRLDLAGGGAGASRPPGRTVTPTREEVAAHRGERDVNVNVYIDGQKVEATVTRRQQKKRGRNAPQRRGVNPGSRR